MTNWKCLLALLPIGLIAKAFPNQRDEIVVVTNVGSDFVRCGVTTQNGTTAQVIVSADGQLGTVVSAERFKKDIASMDKTGFVTSTSYVPLRDEHQRRTAIWFNCRRSCESESRAGVAR
jgi:hypothetical protein